LTAKGVTCLCDRSSPEKEKLREEEEIDETCDEVGS
jgi:hypothetical protein